MTPLARAASQIEGTFEEKIEIDGQWYYRGNRSPAWFALASRADGSPCGIAERLPEDMWPALELAAKQRR